MKPTLKDFITVAVENEFYDKTTQLECKAYLFRGMRNMTFDKIGNDLGVDRHKASKLVKEIENRIKSKSKDRLISNFKLKFYRIEEECKEYAYRLTIEKGIEILEVPTARLKSKRLELINEINWN